MLRIHFSAALVALVALLGPTGCAHADDNATDAASTVLARRGQRLFLRCSSCHQASESDAAKSGPLLKSVVGRHVASVPGYVYSPSLSAQSFDWDDGHLQAWLERPTSIAPGTTMAFEGLPSAADRQAVIAYLKTLR